MDAKKYKLTRELVYKALKSWPEKDYSGDFDRYRFNIQHRIYDLAAHIDSYGFEYGFLDKNGDYITTK